MPSAPKPIVVVMIVMALLGAVTPRAPGQLAAGGAVGELRPAHAWGVAPAPGPTPGAVLLHLPPRRGASAEDGAARVAAFLNEMPEAVAAGEARAFLVFPPKGVSADYRRRQVLSVPVSPGPVEGTWIYARGDRLDPEPALLDAGPLLGFAATGTVPAALVRSDRVNPPRPRLLVRGDGRWDEVALPAETPADAAALLAGTESGLVLALRSGTGVSAWSGALTRAAGTGPRIAWKTLDAPWPAAEEGVSDAGLVAVRGAPLLVRRGAGEIQLFRLDPPSARLIRTMPLAGDLLGVAALDDVSRVAVLWLEPPPKVDAAAAGAAEGERPRAARGGPTIDRQRTRLAEVSALTGEVLTSGPIKLGSPVSADELRIVAFVLSGAMLVVVVLVARPVPEGPPLTLPRGLALATPGRRVGSAMLDLALCAWASSAITGRPLPEVVSLTAWLTRPGAFNALLLALAIGIVYATLAEGLTGRTLGKAVLGCRVVRAKTETDATGTVTTTVRTPGPVRALVRNLVKWLLPPLALSGLSSPEGRHRGDLAAGTAVVVRVPPDPDPA